MTFGDEEFYEMTDPFRRPGQIERIPVQRIAERTDALLAHREYERARHLLSFWLEEARRTGDRRGELSIRNEQIGLCRLSEDAAQGEAVCREALSLAKELGMEDSVSMATILTNAATAYKSFGMPEAALPLYEKAKTIYADRLDAADERRGALCNNMALALAELGDVPAARALFAEALQIMERNADGEPEMAITWCNLADLAVQEMGALEADEEVMRCLDTAKALLDKEGLPRNTHTAFVFEKCAGVFGYYGRFLDERELLARAGEILEGERH